MNRKVAPANGQLPGASDVSERTRRLLRIALLFLVPWLGIVARLGYLQIVRGPHYKAMADVNFVREVPVAPDRGRILDARERVLAENRPSYDILASPTLLALHKEVAERLTTLLSLDESKATQLRNATSLGKGAEIVVRRDVPRDLLAKVETWRNDLPGVYVRVSQRRQYPFDGLGAHALGYVSAIRDDELRNWADLGYEVAEQVGRSGIEKAYEPVLRGAPGLDREVVDARGEVQDDDTARELLGDYRRVSPVPGKDLVLTLDMDLMQIVDDAMGRTPSGAVVAIDPRDGSVLALYSKPGFNPNAWSGRLSDEEKRRIDNDPFKPMFDKTLGAYFPGSTYKVVTGLAALEEGLTTPGREIDCPGYLEFGHRTFRCWNHGGHGDMDLGDALAESCDVYFYQTGLELGMERLARYARDMGFGERPGTGLPAEAAGLVPDKAWHEQHSEGGFQHGFTVNTAVGQGDVKVSPLQLALAYAAIGNGGSLYFPRLVDRIARPDGTTLYEFPRTLRRQLPFSPEHIKSVERGLVAVLQGEDGTAKDFALPYVTAAGKTGTAQVRALDTGRLDNGELAFADRDHAWFVVYAPVSNPRIVVSVFVEHGGHGASAAAPVAMRVVDRYLREVLGWDAAIDLAVDGHDRRRLDALIAQKRAASEPAVVPPTLAPTVPNWPVTAPQGSGATP